MTKLNIFFWQNCISPHQVPYIRHVQHDPRVGRVALIAPRVDYDERRDMGWEAEAMLQGTGLECHVRPTREEIDGLMRFEPARTVHLFSGIRGDHETFLFFLQSRKYQLTRGFIQEPPYTYDKPLWAHYVRFFLQDRKFIRDFNYVFAIGEDAVSYFRSWSKRWKVVPFVYCVERPAATGQPVEGPLRVCYVGSLSRRKNVGVLLKAAAGLPLTLDIYGDGEERAMLEAYAKAHGVDGAAAFHGKVRMGDVAALMQRHDVLVLPSRYDGWGAVVNEALMSGVYAVCSDRCGARLLLADERRGLVFKTNDAHSLRACLQHCLDRKDSLRQGVAERRAWADCIGGKAVATYMVDSLTGEGLPRQPWQ